MKHLELIFALWMLMLKWTGIVDFIVGIAIGYFTRYWIVCCVFSLAIAAFFMNLASSRMRIPPTWDRYAFWIVLLTLPMLVATSCGYIAGQWIRRRRNRRATGGVQA